MARDPSFAPPASDLSQPTLAPPGVVIAPSGGQGFSLDERASQPVTAKEGRYQLEVVSVALDIADTAAHTGGTNTVTIPGLRVGDLCFFLGTVGAITNTASFHFWTRATCSTDDEIVLQRFNSDTASQNPASGSYIFLAIHRFL